MVETSYPICVKMTQKIELNMMTTDKEIIEQYRDEAEYENKRYF